MNGNSISGATSSTLNITQAGSYTLVVSVGGCSSSASNAEIITVTAIQNNQDPLVSIYPNPVTEDLTISWAGHEQESSVTVIDAVGKSILEGGKELLNQKINVSNYKPGLYIVRVVINNYNYTAKFLKK
jgi:hypothetical protein